MIKNPRNYSHPFGDIAAPFERAKAERRQRNAIYRETKAIVENALKPDAATFAQAVIRAAAKARGTVTDDTPRFSNDEHGRRARAIVNSGRKARGQEPI